MVIFVPKPKEDKQAILDDIWSQSALANAKAWVWPGLCLAASRNSLESVRCSERAPGAAPVLRGKEGQFVRVLPHSNNFAFKLREINTFWRATINILRDRRQVVNKITYHLKLSYQLALSRHLIWCCYWIRNVNGQEKILPLINGLSIQFNLNLPNKRERERFYFKIWTK